MSQFGLGELLAVLVDAHGDLDELAAVLVPHVDAVLARVFRGDFVDDEAGKLAAVKRNLRVLGGGDFLLVLEPGDLRGRLAPHGAGQAQRLLFHDSDHVRQTTNHSATVLLSKCSCLKS